MHPEVFKKLFEQGRFISTPSNWQLLFEAWKERKDADLLKTGTSPEGAYYMDEYIAGGHTPWNHAADRKQGDVYWALCKEIVIYLMRQERRKKGLSYQQQALETLAASVPPPVQNNR